jgi:ABC-type transporter lipoprotein component MlaA
MDRLEELDKATEEIIASVKNIYIIKSICKHIKGLPKIASPYLNLRDALFHYQKMYTSQDDRTCIEQQASINEHLNRGIKDFAINLCSNYYIPIFHEMLDLGSDLWIRHIYHELKDLVLEIRLAGQALWRFDDHNVNWLERMITIINTINNSLKNNAILYGIYHQCREKYIQKQKE